MIEILFSRFENDTAIELQHGARNRTWQHTELLYKKKIQTFCSGTNLDRSSKSRILEKLLWPGHMIAFW